MSIIIAADRRRNPHGREPVCCYPDCLAEPWPEARAPLCWDHMVDVSGQVMLEVSDRTPLEPSRSQLHGAVPPLNDQRGQVYFVRFGHNVKIGFTTNLKRRLKDIPHEEILATYPGSRRDEKRCHALFADLRLETTHGREWFHMDQRILDFIAERAA